MESNPIEMVCKSFRKYAISNILVGSEDADISTFMTAVAKHRKKAVIAIIESGERALQRASPTFQINCFRQQTDPRLVILSSGKCTHYTRGNFIFLSWRVEIKGTGYMQECVICTKLWYHLLYCFNLKNPL